MHVGDSKGAHEAGMSHKYILGQDFYLSVHISVTRKDEIYIKKITKITKIEKIVYVKSYTSCLKYIKAFRKVCMKEIWIRP